MTDREIDDLLDLGIEDFKPKKKEEVVVEAEISEPVTVDLPWDDDEDEEESDYETEDESEDSVDEHDFESVLEGFQEIGATLETASTPRQIASVAKRFDSLSEAFGISSEDMVEDINSMIEETKREAVAYKKQGYELTEEIRASAFNIDQLTNHFGIMIETLTSSLQDGRAIQKKFTDEMLMVSIDDISPTVLMGYSEVMKAVTKQVETISKIYREVAETQMKLKGYLKNDKMEEDAKGGGTTNIQNNYILSTQDLINRFKPE